MLPLEKALPSKLQHRGLLFYSLCKMSFVSRRTKIQTICIILQLHWKTHCTHCIWFSSWLIWVFPLFSLTRWWNDLAYICPREKGTRSSRIDRLSPDMLLRLSHFESVNKLSWTIMVTALQNIEGVNQIISAQHTLILLHSMPLQCAIIKIHFLAHFLVFLVFLKRFDRLC